MAVFTDQEIKSKLKNGIKWMTVLGLISAIVIAIFYYMTYGKLESVEVDDSFFVKTKGCTIPRFQPFDKSVREFFSFPSPFLCYNSNSLPLVVSDETSIWVIEEHLPFYGVTELEDFICSYTPFYRESPCKEKNHMYCLLFETSIKFKFRTLIVDEFIQVECQYKDKLIYKDMHSFALKSDKNKLFKEHGSKYSVLILGIDSVSRLNFYRTMPRTLKFLQESNALDFEGYNKVAYNTYPNLMAVLSGLNEHEASDSCYTNENSTFDNCYFVWNNFSEAGYYTAYAEDAKNGIFNYRRNGFLKKPTDYYLRDFIYLAEKDIGHIGDMCYGPRLAVDVLLSYTSKFMKLMKSNVYFGLFWESTLTHDDLNYPQLCDGMYEHFLKSMKENKLLKNTILILMSDHGYRWGSIQDTYQGRMEERLPFLFIVLPKSFRKQYTLAVSNLKMNTRRLTTPFDLHKTLLDLVNTDEIRNHKILEKIENDKNFNTRGTSLFLPIDEMRTCESADIETHWCTCRQTTVLNTNSTLSLRIADTVVNYVNYLLIGYSKCAKHYFSNVKSFEIEKSSSTLTVNATDLFQDYSIIVETHPGDCLFEATIRDTAGNMKVIGTVSRINRYGNQSYCVDDSQIKLYCFCKKPSS